MTHLVAFDVFLIKFDNLKAFWFLFFKQSLFILAKFALGFIVINTIT